MKTALITGITGQDGSYLAEFLLDRGYRVYGLLRRSSTPSSSRIEHILDRINIIFGDLLDDASLMRAVEMSDPDEVYNLAAQSFVPESWTQPAFTSEATGLGAMRLLEAIRRIKPSARYYQASTSEMFGNASHSPQSEATPFRPRSPYGIAKLYAHWITINYRESYGLFACSGILFNHESPRRGLEFVTRKISRAAARISLGLDSELRLGNLAAKRDWGYAPDYVRAMWMMLQLESPQDFVVATGETHSVEEWVTASFGTVGLDWRKYVTIDERLFRPAEVHALCGNPTLARRELDWEPAVSFEELVRLMVESDVAALRESTAEHR